MCIDTEPEKKPEPKKDILQEADENDLEKIIYFDTLFQEENYIGIRNQSYVLLDSMITTNSLYDDEISSNIKAKLHLPKTQKSLHLIIDNEVDDELDKNFKPLKGYKTTQSIYGIEYTVPEFVENIETRARVAISHSLPYAQYSIAYPFNFLGISSKIYQDIKYYTKDGYKEQTELYFNKPFKDKGLLRYSVNRTTEENLKGTRYSNAFTYFYSFKPNQAVSLYVSAGKDTGYEINNGNLNSPKRRGWFDGYEAGVHLKGRLYKKWLNYTIHPKINFSRAFDYKENYSLSFGLELWFGNI